MNIRNNAKHHNQANALFILLGFAAFMRLLMLVIYPQIPPLVNFVEGKDAAGYLQLAENIMHNGAFRFAEGGPTAFRMPGYPLFLAVTSVFLQSPLPAQIVQIVTELFAIFIVYKIAQRLCKEPGMALMAVVFIAFNPLFILSSVALLPETLAVCAISCAILLILRRPSSAWTAVAVALMLSLSIYLKPTLFVVAVALLALFGWEAAINQKSPAMIGGFLLALLIIVGTLAPWVVRNMIVMHAFIPLTTSNGSNLYGGNNPMADGGYVSNEPYVLPGMSELASNRVFAKRALAWIKANPTQFMQLLPAKAARFFWPLAFGTSGIIAVPFGITALLLLVVLVFYGLVACGAWQMLRARRFWELAGLIATPATLFALSLLTFGAARFSLPAFPALAALAALGFQVLDSLFTYQKHAL